MMLAKYLISEDIKIDNKNQPNKDKSDELTTSTEPPLLLVRNLKKSYSRKSGLVLKGLNFEIQKGQIHAFVGENGSGKTTTIKCIIDAYKKLEGEILIKGLPNYSSEAKKAIAYLPEDPKFPSKLKVSTYLFTFTIMMGFKYKKGQEVVNNILEELGLEDVKNKIVTDLSSGQKRKIFFAQSLISDPDLFIMDEPTANLDPGARKDFFKYIKKLRDKGKTFFISTHVLKEIDSYADHVTILERGKVVYSGKKEEDLEQQYFHALES